ncbi:hypothetical protein QVD17_05354 [Tagetes erecta]|uniref:Uncharacterized protein n=1 Tax=Tagetes erecta TaxID=13708 RepID=A0AAD8PB43_TARER|nr:hypothetical protein QVD17_05354 [Tagetes erecta]
MEQRELKGTSQDEASGFDSTLLKTCLVGVVYRNRQLYIVRQVFTNPNEFLGSLLQLLATNLETEVTRTNYITKCRFKNTIASSMVINIYHRVAIRLKLLIG